MMKFIALLTKEKEKMAMNDSEHDGSDISELHTMYIKNMAILLPFLLANLFKHKYLNTSVLLRVIIHIVHHRTPNGIYACILPRAKSLENLLKGPEKSE